MSLHFTSFTDSLGVSAHFMLKFFIDFLVHIEVVIHLWVAYAQNYAFHLH